MKLFLDEQASELRAKPKYEFDEKSMRCALGSAKNFEPGKTSTQILRELRGYDRKSL
jgi:hypothetical protein